MKTSLACLFIALLLNAAFCGAFNEIESRFELHKQVNDIYLANARAGHWATVARFDRRDPLAHGYDPERTVIFTSWKPVLRQVGVNRYQITFTIPDENN